MAPRAHCVHGPRHGLGDAFRYLNHDLLVLNADACDAKTSRQGANAQDIEQVRHGLGQRTKAILQFSGQRRHILLRLCARQPAIQAQAQGFVRHVAVGQVSGERQIDAWPEVQSQRFSCCLVLGAANSFAPLACGLLQFLDGAPQEPHVEIKAYSCDVAVLLGPQQLACPADLHVSHGQPVASAQLGRFLDRLKTLLGHVRKWWPVEEIGVSSLDAPPHASAQLIELCQAIMICVSDDDGVDVGNIQAAFDDGRAEEDIALSLSKAQHDLGQFVFRHLAMGNHDGRFWHDAVQVFGH